MAPNTLSEAIDRNPTKIFWGTVHLLVLMFAVWLVSPLIVITAQDYLVKNSYGLRLALGVMIFIMYVGKWSFDVFAPQGLARRVSNLRSIALIAYIVIVVSFMIYIVAQAASLYLQSGINQDEKNQQENVIQVQAGENRIPRQFSIEI